MKVKNAASFWRIVGFAVVWPGVALAGDPHSQAPANQKSLMTIDGMTLEPPKKTEEPVAPVKAKKKTGATMNATGPLTSGAPKTSVALKEEGEPRAKSGASIAASIPAIELSKPKSLKDAERARELELWRFKRSFVLKPSVGGLGGFDSALGFGWWVGAEFGYHLPWLDRMFGLSLQLGAENTGNESQSASSKNWFFTGTILAAANLPLNSHLVRVFVGPALVYSLSNASLAPTNARFDDASWGFGAEVGAALLFAVGPGGLGIDLRYRALPHRTPLGFTVGHFIVLSATYGWFFEVSK